MTVETVETVESVETVETVETAETVETEETVLTEDLKKKQEMLAHLKNINLQIAILIIKCSCSRF